jgi:hypothetical protein
MHNLTHPLYGRKKEIAGDTVDNLFIATFELFVHAKMSHFLESVRDNPNAMTAKAVAVVGSSLAFLAGLYWLKRNEHECATRRGTLQCFCGQVVVDLYQPAANYKYAEPVNMQCACHDCMDYCEAVSGCYEAVEDVSCTVGIRVVAASTLFSRFSKSLLVSSKGSEGGQNQRKLLQRLFRPGSTDDVVL